MPHRLTPIEYIPEQAAYQVVRFDNGRFGVVDAARPERGTLAAGMDKTQAAEWACRLNYRDVWGV